MNDLSRLCIHTMTHKQWTLEQCVAAYAEGGVPWITVWRQSLAPLGAASAGKLLRASGLKLASLCRGGFFPAIDAAGRSAALDENRRAIDEAAAIGAPLLVLVCGAVPGMPLAEARRQIAEGIADVLPHARAAGVRLGIEPLHPMYADDRSAISTLAQANDLAEELADPAVGVVLDVYHVWWDPALEAEIARCGRERLFAFHVCDWRTPTRDILTDRALMGEGCIDIRRIRGWVEGTGCDGPIEVEIFSEEHWAADPAEYLMKIKRAYLECV